jgi:cell division protein FtsN
MARQGYKKYMKKDVGKDYSLLKVFVFSFFGMLLVFTFLIKSFSPTVDVSIGDYKQETEIENIDEVKKKVDNRLAMIQDEDQGKNFSEMIKKAEDYEETQIVSNNKKEVENNDTPVEEAIKSPALDPVYKVYIGSYTSAEQAKVAKDIITEAGTSLTPIVKCIGNNNYTLQVGIFKNKTSADALLLTIQQSHLPGRIVQEY